MEASADAVSGPLADENTLQGLSDEPEVPSTQFPSSEICDETNPASDHSFVQKLWKIVSSPCFQSVWWGDDGNCIVIAEKLFTEEVLGRMGPQKVFETSSMKGFVHQLNLHGFRKMEEDFPISSSIEELQAIAAAGAALGK
ncbi:PREDICTED: heat shock transcription factor, Y-linked-like, partial [Buceros rhinoceros silvestris]|uniref:heat shock transcription factor, Y-linked-like n=1 Tax=Buceros rhinoceros silvestris TaxID=175836 RepID=UPI000528D79F